MTQPPAYQPSTTPETPSGRKNLRARRNTEQFAVTRECAPIVGEQPSAECSPNLKSPADHVRHGALECRKYQRSRFAACTRLGLAVSFIEGRRGLH